MSEDFLFFSSRFAYWCAGHEPVNHEQSEALREEALGVLIESVNAGEISSLDGTETAMSIKIKDHHGLSNFEMNSHWIGSAQDWACPCCARSKFQIARVGKKNQILAKLVIHHDHMGEALKAAFHTAFEKAGTDVEQIDGQRLVERMGGAFAAYEEVLVCEDCNNADTEAKKQVVAPPFFSFSIGQIRALIRSGNHQPHQVDGSAANHIWQEAKPAYELRMTLIQAVAHAAATDSHWYEPYARDMKPIPVLGYGNRFGDHVIQKWVSTQALYKALGQKTKQSTRNLSRWRTTSTKPGRSLPTNFLAMLCSEETSSNSWNAVPEEWSCPICKRSKQQIVYVADKGKVSFYLRSNLGRGSWAAAARICNQCTSTLMSLKLEISDLIGSTPRDSYGFISPDELANIIIPRPHSPHSIRAAEAAALVTVVVQRLT